jgi:CRP/FNR family transcriptional regulator, anaerobic regulatory protein
MKRLLPETSVSPKELQKLKMFAGLSANELQRLSAEMKLLRIKRRHSVLVEGRAANEMICVLLSGVVKVSAINGELSPVLMGVVVAGEIFGLHSLLQEPVYRFQCEAFTDCVVAQIPGRAFCQIVLPGVPFDSFKLIIEMSLGRWWWGLPVWYSRMTRLSVHDRVIAMLLELGRKFGVLDSRGTIITLPLSRDGLAEMIGASRQTVSLEIEDLVRDGSLIRDGRRLLVTESAHSRSPRHKS